MIVMLRTGFKWPGIGPSGGLCRKW